MLWVLKSNDFDICNIQKHVLLTYNNRLKYDKAFKLSHLNGSAPVI
jgi:hypothetical protein